MAIEYPWPDAPERVSDRVRGMVESVVRADELAEVRLEWVTPTAHQFDRPGAGWVALRLTVLARGDEGERFEFWSPGLGLDWESALAQLANDLEDWVCLTLQSAGDVFTGTNTPGKSPWGTCHSDRHGYVVVNANGSFSADRATAHNYSVVSDTFGFSAGGHTGYTNGIHVKLTAAGTRTYACGDHAVPNMSIIYNKKY